MASFGGTDRSWIEITIAMDEQLLPLLALVGPESALYETSQQVKDFTEEELVELRRLYGEAGLPTENPHTGMPMPGMVTAGDITAATRVRGEKFDGLVRERLRAHLEQSLRLAGSEQSAGLETRTVALAARISETRRTTLQKLS